MLATMWVTKVQDPLGALWKSYEMHMRPFPGEERRNISPPGSFSHWSKVAPRAINSHIGCAPMGAKGLFVGILPWGQGGSEAEMKRHILQV